MDVRGGNQTAAANCLLASSVFYWIVRANLDYEFPFA